MAVLAHKPSSIMEKTPMSASVTPSLGRCEAVKPASPLAEE